MRFPNFYRFGQDWLTLRLREFNQNFVNALDPGGVARGRKLRVREPERRKYGCADKRAVLRFGSLRGGGAACQAQTGRYDNNSHG